MDVVIVGGGISGVLLAHRLHLQNPGLQIQLVEKESVLGGRLSKSKGGRWGYGLGRISSPLFDFWNQSFRTKTQGPDLPQFGSQNHSTIGFLTANQLHTTEKGTSIDRTNAGKLAGGAVARDWELVEELFSPDKMKKTHQALAQLWPGDRKSPSVSVLENLGRVLGIADLWTAQLHVFHSRLYQSYFTGRWQEAMTSMLENTANSKITVQTGCQVMEAIFHEKKYWKVKTTCGILTAKKLVVALPPWDAIGWLSKEHWPVELLNVITKTRPVSVVALCEHVRADNIQFAHTTVIPAEKVQVHADDGEICYQGTLTYENSLQAPAVVKMVRKLKRARKKFHTFYTNLETKGEHIALLPCGWAQPYSATDTKWTDKLEKASFQQQDLAFCGDAYGSQRLADCNIIDSVISASEALMQA